MHVTVSHAVQVNTDLTAFSCVLGDRL